MLQGRTFDVFHHATRIQVKGNPIINNKMEEKIDWIRMSDNLFPASESDSDSVEVRYIFVKPNKEMKNKSTQTQSRKTKSNQTQTNPNTS